MKAMRKNIKFVVAALAMLAVTAVAAVAGEDQVGGTPDRDVAKVATIEPDALGAVEALREPRVAGDALPAGVAARAERRANFGLNPALSRRVVGNTTNSLYVIPARGYICAALTVGEGANYTCPSTQQVESGQAGPATVILTTGDIGIYGIVPDGVESVFVHTGTSRSTALRTQDNAYYTVLPAKTPLKSVSYDGPSGNVEFPIYDPSLAFKD